MKAMSSDHLEQAACFVPKSDVVTSCWLRYGVIITHSDSA